MECGVPLRHLVGLARHDMLFLLADLWAVVGVYPNRTGCGTYGMFHRTACAYLHNHARNAHGQPGKRVSGQNA